MLLPKPTSAALYDYVQGAAITEYRIHSRLLSIAIDSKMLVHNKIRDDFFYGAMKDLIKKILRTCGLKVTKYNNSNEYRFNLLLKHHNVDLIIDCGANTGQYTKYLRSIGYRGRIVSIEPLTYAFQKLRRNSKNDSMWEAMNFALGDFDGNATINVAGNSLSSSLLEMLPSHVKVVPESVYIGTEDISIKTLDTVFESIKANSKSVFLKLDTQGYENKIIDGAKNSLPEIVGIQMELSLILLYKDEILFLDMIERMMQKGFMLMSIIPVFSDHETGQFLQVDSVFFRKP